MIKTRGSQPASNRLPMQAGTRWNAKIDRNLEDSFPASDPPEWVLGVEREDKHAPGKF